MATLWVILMIVALLASAVLAPSATVFLALVATCGTVAYHRLLNRIRDLEDRLR